MNLEISRANKAYGDLTVLRDFSLTFPQVGTLCLFGPSGCGKTTLMNLLAGLERLDSGEVLADALEKRAYVFQQDRLLPWCTAEENLAAVLRGPTARAQSREWLRLVGLAGVENKRPGELSGGMRQRVSIARALAFGAPLLLLDEPFHALDEENKARMMALLLEKTPNSLKILVTHERAEAEAMADVILLAEGPPLTVRECVKNNPTAHFLRLD